MARNTLTTALLAGLLLLGTALILLYSAFPTPGLFNATRVQRMAAGRTAQIIALGKTSGQNSIHGLALQVAGEIDGTALITQGYAAASVLRTDTVRGAFSLSYGGDWYQDSCFVTYVPLTARAGRLEVTYRFRGTNSF